jgi:hypothetical protein
MLGFGVEVPEPGPVWLLGDPLPPVYRPNSTLIQSLLKPEKEDA